MLQQSRGSDNKPPLSNSIKNNPSIHSVPSGGLLLPYHGSEGGPVPVLYLVCSLSMGLCRCYHPLPPASPGSPFRSVTWHSHSALISQCTPVICTSLTCTQSDVQQGTVALFHPFQRKSSAGLGGQSVASWIRTSYFLGGSVGNECVNEGWELDLHLKHTTPNL